MNSKESEAFIYAANIRKEFSADLYNFGIYDGERADEIWEGLPTHPSEKTHMYFRGYAHGKAMRLKNILLNKPVKESYSDAKY